MVGVDSASDFPDAALDVRRGDLQPDSADLGPILSLDPDVVIIGEDPTGLAQRLAAEGVASFSGPQPESLDEVYEQVLGIAAIVGRADLGDELVASMRTSIDASVASVPARSNRTYFHEIDPSLVTITPGNFLDAVYGEFGLESIVAPDPSGFTVATADQVLSADPDVVMLADVECCRGDRRRDRPAAGMVLPVGHFERCRGRTAGLHGQAVGPASGRARRGRRRRRRRCGLITRAFAPPPVTRRRVTSIRRP